MIGQHLVDGRAGLVDVFAIGHAEMHIHTAYRVVAVIDDLVAPDLAVGNNDLLIVECLKHCGEQGDLVHLPKLPSRVNEIAHLVGAEHHQHDPRREIRHRSLQSQADREAGRAEQRHDGGRLNAKTVQDRNDDKSEDNVLRDAPHEAKQRVVQPLIAFPIIRMSRASRILVAHESADGRY